LTNSPDCLAAYSVGTDSVGGVGGDFKH